MSSNEVGKVLDQVRKSLDKVAETVVAHQRGGTSSLQTTAKAHAPQVPLSIQPTASRRDSEWSPHWTDGAAAVEAIKQSVKVVTDAFDARGEKSLKFDFEKTAASAVEIAERAQWLLGKSRKIKVQALEEKESRGWAKPPSGEIYCKKLGDNKVGGLRVVFPAINGMPSTEVSIQVQLKNGAVGARPVTIQGTRLALTAHAKAWVMTFGPIKQLASEHCHTVGDLDMSGYM